MARWFRTYRRKVQSPPDGIVINDLWDLIHFLCPLSNLEAIVLVHRYILGKGERELAAELGVGWRVLNRATWRMKCKLRGQLESIYRLPDFRDRPGQ